MIRLRRPLGTFDVDISIEDLAATLDEREWRALRDARERRQDPDAQPLAWSRTTMVSIEVSLNDIAGSLFDEDVIALAEANGLEILPKDALEAASSRIGRRDLPGALMALDDAMPRRWRGLGDRLERLIAAPAGARP